MNERPVNAAKCTAGTPHAADPLLDRARVDGAVRPLVSVVIPVRNDAARLEVCLASLARQDLPQEQFEVIVVDNGSQDGSAEVARRYGATVLVFHELRVGALRNRGVEAARAPLIAFVDSDHECPPDWLSQGVHLLEGEPGLTAVGFPYLAPPAGTWVQRAWELQRVKHRGSASAAWLAAGNLFVRRAAFDEARGFREELIATEDVDLCVRLAARGAVLREDVRVANIHHGEPVSLATFFRKEAWRGTGGLWSFFQHGAPRHELPSILYPLYHLLAVVGCALAAVGGVRGGGWAPLGWMSALLILPSVLMGVRTAGRQGRGKAALPLSVLYLTYGLARAAVFLSSRRGQDDRGQNPGGTEQGGNSLPAKRCT